MMQYIHPIIQYLHLHPHWGGIITFFIALIESLAIIGTVIPGSVTMTAIGVLIGTNVLPAGPTILWAIFGAYCGDCISYWFGAHYKNKIRSMWPFKKYGHWLDKGEAFFKRHGGKSVVIGRFAGPVRSVVPMVAGLLDMPVVRFLFVTFITAILWAFVYMTPGILIGALSTELPPSLATKFILICLLILFCLWLIAWLIKFFFDQTWNQIDRVLIKWWNYLNIHKNSHWITQMLRNPTHDEDHQQLVRAVFTIFFLLLFTWVTVCVALHQGILMHLNAPLYNLLQSVRVHALDNFFLSLTLLGDKHVLLLMAAIVLLWLSWRKHWWAALHWFVLILLSVFSIEFFKHIVHSTRPPHYAFINHSSSFPSGHTVLSLTLFGFLAVLISDNLPPGRRAPIFITAIILVFLIGFSRIYLGPHWLTDILASVYLAMVLLLSVVLSYRRRNQTPISASSLGLIACSVTVFIWISYSYFNFTTTQQEFTSSWPIQIVTEQQWWTQPLATQIPLYRTSRVGQPAQPLNVEWWGSLDRIEKTLTQQGWQKHSPKLDMQTINRLVVKQTTNLPILPMLYHDRAPALLMLKQQQQGQPFIMLRLWYSDVAMNGGQIPFWLGTVNYYQPPAKLLSLPKHAQFQDAISSLTADLKHFHFRLLMISPSQQPPEMSDLHWDGKLLLIK
jgi:membrane protein DedA with SNARE-associated domain/membrane-associated phospholipid phosphatase